MVRADEVDAIAKLARLALSAEERAALPVELSAVLGYMTALAEIDTAGIEPMIYGTAPAAEAAAAAEAASEPAQQLADDVMGQGEALPAAVAVSGATQVRAMQFVVPNVLPGAS